jgi:hypothetical protein
MFAQPIVPHPPAHEPIKHEPLVIAQCSCQLWEGVRCALPTGHAGSHFRSGTADGCELRWR